MVINKRVDASFSQATVNLRDEVRTEPLANLHSGHDTLSAHNDAVTGGLNRVLLQRRAVHKKADQDAGVMLSSSSLLSSMSASGPEQQDAKTLALLPRYAAGEDLTLLSQEAVGFTSRMGEVGSQANAEHQRFLARVSPEQRAHVQRAIQARAAALLRQENQRQVFFGLLPDYAAGAVWGQLRQQHPLIHRILTNAGGFCDSPLAKTFVGSLNDQERAQVQEAIALRRNAVGYLKLAPHLIQILRAFAHSQNDLTSVAQSVGVDKQALRTIFDERGLTPLGHAFLAEQSSAVRGIAQQALQQRQAQMDKGGVQSDLSIQSVASGEVQSASQTRHVSGPSAVDQPSLPEHITQVPINGLRSAVSACILGLAQSRGDGLPYTQAAHHSGISEETLRLLLTQNSQGALELTPVGQAYLHQCCTAWERGTLQAVVRAINS